MNVWRGVKGARCDDKLVVVFARLGPACAEYPLAPLGFLNGNSEKVACLVAGAVSRLGLGGGRGDGGRERDMVEEQRR